MPAALMGFLRAALPWVASLLGGYVVSDVYNERQTARQNAQKVNYPDIVTRVIKRNPGKWKFLAIGGAVVGVLVAFIIKKLK